MIKSFLKNSSGVAAIEFAILLPFLLIVFFGAFQVSGYIMNVRRVDNVANDIGYILSREGGITAKSGKDFISPATGGKTRIEAILNNTLPFLLGANAYNPDGPAAVRPHAYIKYVGLPRFADTSANDGCKPAIPNQTTARVMWAHSYPAGSTLKSTMETGSVSACTGNLCPKACNNKNYDSLYSDKFGTRSNIVFPGQGFIMVNFSAKYNPFFKTFFKVGTNIMPERIEKLSSYAVRSRWVDNGNNIVEANELKNTMHFCTDCTLPSSGMTQNGAALRQACTPVANFTNRTRPSSGCDFY